jgi:hypothetical protein
MQGRHGKEIADAANCGDALEIRALIAEGGDVNALVITTLIIKSSQACFQDLQVCPSLLSSTVEYQGEHVPQDSLNFAACISPS